LPDRAAGPDRRGPPRLDFPANRGRASINVDSADDGIFTGGSGQNLGGNTVSSESAPDFWLFIGWRFLGNFGLSFSPSHRVTANE
jgi:hypothetical protein